MLGRERWESAVDGMLDDALIDRARELTGIQEKTALVRAALEALIARGAGLRLAALGGTNPKMAGDPIS